MIFICGLRANHAHTYASDVLYLTSAGYVYLDNPYRIHGYRNGLVIILKSAIARDNYLEIIREIELQANRGFEVFYSQRDY